MSELSPDRFQQAFVLHTRPYQNSSLLVDFFTEQNGLLRCVAKGQRSKKNASQLALFCCYQASFSGRSELKTLAKLEPVGKRFLLEKKALYCGLYANEVLLRLLYKHDPHPASFEAYIQLLESLSEIKNLESALRRFEFSLLQDIGYLVDMRSDYISGEEIQENTLYRYDQERGFALVEATTEDVYLFSGKALLEIANMCFEDEQTQKQAKVLARLMLSPYLGDKPLNSKLLFKTAKVKAD